MDAVARARGKDPDEAAVLEWAGVDLGHAIAMSEDIWNILTNKIRSPSRSALITSLRLGGTPLLRTSRAWHDIIRDSGGRLSDRKFRLYGEISNPTRARTWATVPILFREWERRVTEFESLTGTKVDEAVKCHATLALLPQDLKEQAQSQVHLEQSFQGLRDYVLAQAGRKQQEELHRTRADMDVNHLPKDAEEPG